VALREAIEASPFKNRSAFLAAAGTQPPVLYRYETGEQSPRLDQIAEWAALLRCAPEQLTPFAHRTAAERERNDLHPDLEEFFATQVGKQTTPEERRTLSVLVARHGRARSLEIYESLIDLLRIGFEFPTAATAPSETKSTKREKQPPASGDREARPTRRSRKPPPPGR
jgi:hypothetical protein